MDAEPAEEFIIWHSNMIERIRKRDENGQFIANDPDTPEDEAESPVLDLTTHQIEYFYKLWNTITKKLLALSKARGKRDSYGREEDKLQSLLYLVLTEEGSAPVEIKYTFQGRCERSE